jgi:hypothetical protein
MPAVRLDDGWPERRLGIQVLDFRRHVEEALGSEEEAVFRTPHSFGDPQVFVQIGVGGARAESKVPGTSLGVEAQGHRDGLEQRRLSRAVLPDEEGHFRMQVKHVEPPHRRKREGVAIKRLDDVSPEGYAADVLAGDHD